MLAAIDQTVQLSASPRDPQGNSLAGKAIAWASSEASVATISESGLATALANGTTTISASADGVTGSTALTVSQQGNALRVVVQPAGADAGVPLATQPAVEVLDANGHIAQNDDASVMTAGVASGGGSIIGSAEVTVQAGVATFTDLAVGGLVGERTLAFSAGQLASVVSETFTLMAGPAATLSLESGDEQVALADTQLPEPLAVNVQDAFGNAVRDIAVSWSVNSGSGSLSANDVSTDEEGVSSVTYLLGRFAGTETVEATADALDGSPVTLALTATPNGRIAGTVTLTNQLMTAGAIARASETFRSGARAAGGGPRLMPPPRSAAGERTASLGLAGHMSARSGPPEPAVRPPSVPEFVPGELIITFRAQALAAPRVGASAYRTPATAAAVAASMRAALARHERIGGMTVLGASPAVLAARVRVDDPGAMAAAEQALREDPTIARVERNAVMYSFGTSPPRNAPHPERAGPDAAAGSQLASRRASGSARSAAATTPNDPVYPFQAWHYHMIDLPRAWDITTGSASVVVAVLDDGIRFDHPDIAPNLTSDGYDFVSDGSLPLCAGGFASRTGDGDGYDSDPTIPVSRPWSGTCAGAIQQSGGHGLHVAGTIGAAGDNGIGVTGVNWSVAIRPVRVMDIAGIGSSYDIAQGILYAAGLPADDGAGGTVTAPSAARIINMSLGGPVATILEQDAVIAATNAGSLIIAAAGNQADSEPNYPAAFPEVLSVSAVGPDASLAPYSNFGPTIDIAAPGGALAQGCDFGVTSTTWNFVAGTPSLDCYQGTSMASPHVAGVAALLLAVDPGLTVSQLRTRLLSYAVDLGEPNLYGAGIVNARNSLTQSFAPPASLYARLIEATTGATIATVPAGNGSYTFAELEDGEYHVFAGQDENGDGNLAVPLRRWGAAGGSAEPSVVAVDGAGDYPASFQIGLPIELEPNDHFNTADVLPLGGYMLGTISDPSNDVDVFRVRVASAGSHVFETLAVAGACGFALEEDTMLGLYDAGGTLITSNEDIDAASLNFCSRITTMLQPGTYYIGVFGNFSGRYAVSAREGS